MKGVLFTAYKKGGIFILRMFDALVGVFSKQRTVFEPSEFPFYDILKENHSVFLKEYLQNSSDKMHNIGDFWIVDEYLVNDDHWKAVPLVLFNNLFPDNVKKYPETYRIASQLPGCRSIMISAMEPGKHLSAHKGIYRGFYRCLYTILVQENADCWIRIEDKKHYFKQGESIVFDETAEHEVLNNSQGLRIVLYLDLYRKLPFPLNFLNTAVYNLLRNTFFVAGMVERYQKLQNIKVKPYKPTPAILP